MFKKLFLRKTLRISKNRKYKKEKEKITWKPIEP
jgi:hypothetical protein